ncbi:MAG TPA: ABC transporter permease, partial [Candidatus Limnocylindrales bacterium]|nr:ABC transporter permease [Candidatus Limnocylindrales bacterium]
MSWLLRHIRPEQVREVSLVVIIVAVAAFFATQIPGFVSGRTFERISSSVAIVAVVAVGQTLVVLTRNIDLSVGSIVGLVAYVVGTLLAARPDLPAPVAVGLSIAIGAGLGALNGAIVAYGRVPAIIATLGTLAIYRVVLVELSGARTVTTDTLPDWLLEIPRNAVLSIGDVDLRQAFVVALGTVVAFQLVLRYLPFGRRLFAIGSNPDAASMAGLPVRRDVFVAFVLSGALAGLAGFMFLARFGNITVVAGQGLELQVVAAVVVGGVNIFGGSGSTVGAFLGAALIDLLQLSLIRWLEVSEFVRDAILGMLILLAVASDAVILRRLRAIWARQV